VIHISNKISNKPANNTHLSTAPQIFKDIESAATVTILSNDYDCGDDCEAILILKEDYDSIKKRHCSPSPHREEGRKADPSDK